MRVGPEKSPSLAKIEHVGQELGVDGFWYRHDARLVTRLNRPISSLQFPLTLVTCDPWSPRHYVTKLSNMTPDMTLSGARMGRELN
jgi:hypothetical protein